MAITPVADLVAKAERNIEVLTVEAVASLMDDQDVLIIDIRDIRELEVSGRIPGARHVPRGMMEFWLDPASPYHKPWMNDGRRLVFYCASGWRSALTADTAQIMGRERVAHMAGGMTAWLEAGQPVERRES